MGGKLIRGGPSGIVPKKSKSSIIGDRLRNRYVSKQPTAEEIKQNTLNWRAKRATRLDHPKAMAQVTSAPNPAAAQQSNMQTEAEAAAARKAMNSPDYVAPEPAPAPVQEQAMPIPEPAPAPAMQQPAANAPAQAAPSPDGRVPGRLKRRFGSIFRGR